MKVSESVMKGFKKIQPGEGKSSAYEVEPADPAGGNEQHKRLLCCSTKLQALTMRGAAVRFG